MTGADKFPEIPPMNLSGLPDDHQVMICDHVFHGKRTVGDVYFYLAGDISMSCARPDCDSDDPADWHTVSMASMRELDPSLSGCPEIAPGCGFERASVEQPWTPCPYETEETEH
jgi:hypothetical protein